MSVPSPSRLSLLALVSAVLGLFCFTGPVAAFLGWVALRAVNGSDGRLRGAALAVFGVATGVLGTVLLVLGSFAIAVNTVREKSNRTECQYNLGKIGLAVYGYFDHHGQTFPPAFVPLPARPPEEHLSWLASILPFLEERPDQTSPWQPLAARLDFDRAWNDPANLPAVRSNVSRFLCRSHPYFDPRGNPGLTHYVGIAGVGADAASLPVTDPRAGMFGFERVIGLKDITAGTSHTLLAAETTADNGPWAAGGPPTERGVDPDETCYIGPGRAFGGCHRDGTNDLLTAAYADASVRFVDARVNPKVFRSSACLAGDPAGR